MAFLDAPIAVGGRVGLFGLRGLGWRRRLWLRIEERLILGAPVIADGAHAHDRTLVLGLSLGLLQLPGIT